jgi:hypothetical protein
VRPETIWLVALLVSCADGAPRASADEAMRGALASALQARGRDAVGALRALDPAGLDERSTATRACMLERLGERQAPAIPFTDPFLSGTLTGYREYWLRALLEEQSPAENEGWLLSSLNQLVRAAGGDTAASLDGLEPSLERLVRARDHHVLLGVTQPLRELMLWKAEAESRYEVELPEGMQAVTVVFMDDFVSLGWAGFATCDRHHTGGWTKPERLYAVRSAYDTTSENFRVSYLAHEAQHFADNRNFPGLDRQEELEYRAKLVELAVAPTSVHDLLETFARNVGDDVSVPHSYANGRVVRHLGQRLFPGSTGAPAWRAVSRERINTAAADLLREDTARLKGSAGP